MNGRRRSLLLALALLLPACGSDHSENSCSTSSCQSGLVFDFSEGTQGWTAGFADYPAGQAELYGLTSAIAPLPDEVGPGSGFFIAGTNYSDDLFMYITRRLAGLVPGRRYRVDLAVEFAANAPADCIGVGGAPGEHVTLKGGAAARAPEPFVDDSGFFRMNIDKGNQAQGGVDAAALGHIGNSNPCPSELYQLKTLSGSQAAAANESGELWIIVGTDSGFEGRTGLYYRRIEIELRE